MEAASITRIAFPEVGRDAWLASLGAAAQEAGHEAWHVRAARAPAFRAPLGAGPYLQRIDERDPLEANRRARAALDAGASGLAIVFEDTAISFGGGLPASSEALAAALEGLPLNRVRLRLDPHPASRQSVDWLVQILSQRRLDPGRLNLAFGLDPAAIFAGGGRLNMSLEALEASLPQSIGHFFALGVPALLLEADARVAHNAGASPARELGAALAAAVMHLRMFETARQPLVYAAPHIGFTVAADTDAYLSAVKVAALRATWRKAQQICAIEPSTAWVHASTSHRLTGGSDDGVQIAAVLGATLAGADTVAAHRSLPVEAIRTLDAALSGIAARPGSRLAADAGDIAALADDAWREFLTLEAEGGILYSLAAGALQRRVAADLHAYETGEPATLDAPAASARRAGEATFTCEPLVSVGPSG